MSKQGRRAFVQVSQGLWSGTEVWDFYQGPPHDRLGSAREARIAHIKTISDFARQCGITAVQTHCGFIPENPNDPVYKDRKLPSH